MGQKYLVVAMSVDFDVTKGKGLGPFPCEGTCIVLEDALTVEMKGWGWAANAPKQNVFRYAGEGSRCSHGFAVYNPHHGDAYFFCGLSEEISITLYVEKMS